MDLKNDVQFSVVIPLFNKELSIGRAIRSVLGQTFPNFELIIVNDGSSDRSLEVAKEFHDSRIRIFNQENAGVSLARNRGLQAACSDFIAFLDADDAWHPERLSSALAHIVRDPGEIWWSCRYARRTMHGCSLPKADRLTDEGYDRICLFREGVRTLPIHISSVIFRTDVLKKMGGFPAGVRFGEDQDVFCRFAADADLPMDQRFLAYYYTDAENRACGSRSPGALPPFYLSCISELKGKQLRDTREWWMKEFIFERLLDEASLRFQTPGFRGDAIRLLWKCRETRLQFPRFIKGLFYALIPSRAVRSLVRFKKIRN